MHPQYLSVQLYPITPSSLTKTIYGAEDVIGEAARLPQHSTHVKVPQRPLLLYGNLPGLYTTLAQQFDAQKDARGYQLRITTPILLAVVMSYPVAIRRLNVRKKLDVKDWMSRCVSWLKQKYGRNLKAVVGHLDESFPHLHALVTSRGKSVKYLHDGHLAAMRPQDSRPAGERYRKAMRLLQLEFWREVSRHFLQSSRSKNPRKRTTRKKHLAGYGVRKDGAEFRFPKAKLAVQSARFGGEEELQVGIQVSGPRTKGPETTQHPKESTNADRVRLSHRNKPLAVEKQDLRAKPNRPKL